MRRLLRTFIAITGLALGCPVSGQSIGYYAQQTLPIVAQTGSYTSTIYIHNPGVGAIDVTFTYYGATASATPTIVACNNMQVAPGDVGKTTLAALCPALIPGSNFGALASGYSSFFALYSRVETPAGNGFSIEGFDGSCCVAVRDVVGLRRQAAFPGYQSNCFIYNQEARAGRVVITLVSGDGQLVASKLLDPQNYEVVRLLDVFAEVNAPAGDYDNVRAQFQSLAPLGGGTPIDLFEACTVQNTASFDADFRVAKSHS